MDEVLSFAVKEEILRTVLKKHNTVFLSGWSKTGKTTTALKTISYFEVRLYFSHSNESKKKALAIDPDIQLLSSLSKYTTVDTEDTVLVIDDYSTADTVIRQDVLSILQRKNTNTRLLLIVRAFIDIKELIIFADALLRFKKNTAEVVFSRLQEAENV